MEGERNPLVDKNNTLLIYFLCLLSFLFFAVYKLVVSNRGEDGVTEMARASQTMREAENALFLCQDDKGLGLYERADVNRTGLIGLETSPITTTLGNLEAKRTTTNPDFAALLVRLLAEAGVKRGETIAVGASGSFPALIVAALSAAKGC